MAGGEGRVGDRGVGVSNAQSFMLVPIGSVSVRGNSLRAAFDSRLTSSVYTPTAITNRAFVKGETPLREGRGRFIGDPGSDPAALLPKRCKKQRH